MATRECNKKKYLSKATADTVLDRIRSDPVKKVMFKNIKRSYQCEICRFWHLTSVPLRTF